VWAWTVRADRAQFWRAVDARRRAGSTEIEIVAVNDITDNATLAHLLKYDSILGRLPNEVSSTEDEIVVDGAAQGHGVGSSLLEQDRIEVCRTLLESGKIVLPTDVVVAESVAADATSRVVAAVAIPDGWMGLDIGPESVRAFAEVLARAATVFRNGPMGVFEMARFAEGTRGVAGAIVESGRSPWSVVETPPRRYGCSACPRTGSRTSRPAAGRRWSTWRASPFPASGYRSS
jgi:3-phosphoglycerate kinase